MISFTLQVEPALEITDACCKSDLKIREEDQGRRRAVGGAGEKDVLVPENCFLRLSSLDRKRHCSRDRNRGLNRRKMAHMAEFATLVCPVAMPVNERRTRSHDDKNHGHEIRKRSAR